VNGTQTDQQAAAAADDDDVRLLSHRTELQNGSHLIEVFFIPTFQSEARP